MKIQNYIYTLLVLLVALLPVGCTDENEIFSEAKGDKVLCTFKVTLPGASETETRAFGNNYTFLPSDFCVAVFQDVGGVRYLDEFAMADAEKGIVQKNDGGDDYWEFGVKLSETDGPRRLHIIANYPGLTMGFGEEGQLIGRLKANGDNHDVYWNYVDVDEIVEGFQENIQKVPLVRNYVKVQVEMQAAALDNFVPTAYALYNVPTQGTVAPYNPASAEYRFANFVTGGVCQTYDNLLNTQGYEGNEPYDDGSLFSTELNWIEYDAGFPAIYMYERSNRNAATPTSLIVKGKYDGGNDTYYKLDFVYDDKESGAKVYYNLLRNFIYTMKINSVTGHGYNSADEAIRQPASNNIGGDAVAEEYTNISDGSGRLFVSTTFMMLTEECVRYVYYKFIPDITTGVIVNDSVKVTAAAGNVLSTAAENMGDETTGEYSGWRKFKITSKAPTAVAQSQELVFASRYAELQSDDTYRVKGALQRKVELLLRNPYVLTVDVPDLIELGTKQDVPVTITLPTGIPLSLFPLKLFISSEDNTIYPDYGTNMPAEAQNGKYGFIREVSLLEYQNSTSYACKFLTNCWESATTVNVDNEYFNRGSDDFGNKKLTSIKITNSQKVTVQQDYNRYPMLINNGGTESVTVKLNGSPVGTITIDSDNVTNTEDVEYTSNDGFNRTDVLTFTFEDQYSGRYNWQNKDTYTATCTVEQLLSGITLDFKR